MLRVAVTRRLGDFTLQAAFEGPAAGVTILFGASGAGKSALLACLAGASRPDTGRIALGGQVMFDAQAGVDLPMERRRIGWVFQDARLFPHLSVESNLRYGLSRAPGRGGSIALDEVTRVLGIESLLPRRPRDLSGGERQRVGLGRALLSQPRLLLMDEPLAALDAPRKAEILPFLERLKAAFDLPIVYVTHSLAEAVRLGDHMVVLDRGQVTAQGPLAEVVGQAGLGLHLSDAGAVLDGVIAGHDPAGGLSRLRAGDWEIRVPALTAAVEGQARVFILARDVMLAREQPRRISARNVLHGRVQTVAAQPGGGVIVTVEKAGRRLLALLTSGAVADLELAPGVEVWAVVKSVAIEGAGGGLLAAIDG